MKIRKEDSFKEMTLSMVQNAEKSRMMRASQSLWDLATWELIAICRKVFMRLGKWKPNFSG